MVPIGSIRYLKFTYSVAVNQLYIITKPDNYFDFIYSCPDWCYWGIEDLGGLCSSPLWSEMVESGEIEKCMFAQDHPRFKRQKIMTPEEYEHMTATGHPHVFIV